MNEMVRFLLRYFVIKNIKELGGEEYTREVKGKNGGSKANLYWDKSGRVYTIPNDGNSPQWVDTVPR